MDLAAVHSTQKFCPRSTCFEILEFHKNFSLLNFLTEANVDLLLEKINSSSDSVCESKFISYDQFVGLVCSEIECVKVLLEDSRKNICTARQGTLLENISDDLLTNLVSDYLDFYDVTDRSQLFKRKCTPNEIKLVLDAVGTADEKSIVATFFTNVEKKKAVGSLNVERDGEYIFNYIYRK